MRVLMVSKACVVRAYRRKLEELARLGAELTLIVPPYWKDERGVLPLERGEEEGYRLVVETMALNGHYHLHFYPRLGKHIAAFRPDIVHIDEEPYNLATFQAMWLARRSGAKALFFTWQNLYRRYPPPFRWMERYNYTRADFAIAGNQEAVRVLRRKGYRGPVAVIPQFGVDEEVFRPLDGERPSRPFSIGFVGRLVEEKGVHVLVEAVSGLEGDWRLRILGSGPEEKRLKALVEAKGLSGRVSFERPLPSAEMPEFYRSLDVLVLPSLTRPNWKEQFGRVLVEAMACGVPVVGSDCGEIPNVIGEAGLLFPEGDADALLEALRRLQEDLSLRLRLSHLGRQRVLERYTQKKVAARTWEVYKQLV